MIIRIHRSFFGGQQRCCSVVEPPSMVRTNPSEVKKATYWKTYWRSNLDLILLPRSEKGVIYDYRQPELRPDDVH